MTEATAGHVVAGDAGHVVASDAGHVIASDAGHVVAGDAGHVVVGDHATRRILQPQDIDRVGEAVLALTSEVWVLTDRLIVIEAILEAKGMNLRTAIEEFVPTPECERVLAVRRETLINAVVGALKT